MLSLHILSYQTSSPQKERLAQSLLLHLSRLHRWFRNSIRTEPSVSVTTQALAPAINKLELVKIFPLHGLEAFLAPRARQVVLRDLHRRRRAVPVQQPQHVCSSHECDVFRAYPEAKQARRDGTQGVAVAVSSKPWSGLHHRRSAHTTRDARTHRC